MDPFRNILQVTPNLQYTMRYLCNGGRRNIIRIWYARRRSALAAPLHVALHVACSPQGVCEVAALPPACPGTQRAAASASEQQLSRVGGGLAACVLFVPN